MSYSFIGLALFLALACADRKEVRDTLNPQPEIPVTHTPRKGTVGRPELWSEPRPVEKISHRLTPAIIGAGSYRLDLEWESSADADFSVFRRENGVPMDYPWDWPSDKGYWGWMQLKGEKTRNLLEGIEVTKIGTHFKYSTELPWGKHYRLEIGSRLAGRPGQPMDEFYEDLRLRINHPLKLPVMHWVDVDLRENKTEAIKFTPYWQSATVEEIEGKEFLKRFEAFFLTITFTHVSPEVEENRYLLNFDVKLNDSAPHFPWELVALEGSGPFERRQVEVVVGDRGYKDVGPFARASIPLTPGLYNIGVRPIIPGEKDIPFYRTYKIDCRVNSQ